MIFSKLKELFSGKHNEDVNRLVAMFPANLYEDVVIAAKVIPFSHNPMILADGSEPSRIKHFKMRRILK